MIRVMMVEDHPIVQAGLARIVASLPDVELVTAVEKIEDLPGQPAPDVLLLDLHLPGQLQGLAGVRYLVDLGLRVLVVTGDDTGIEEVGDAIAAGALGYLTKHATADEYAATSASRWVSRCGSLAGSRWLSRRAHAASRAPIYPCPAATARIPAAYSSAVACLVR